MKKRFTKVSLFEIYLIANTVYVKTNKKWHWQRLGESKRHKEASILPFDM